jgi:hypothetical protein
LTIKKPLSSVLPFCLFLLAGFPSPAWTQAGVSFDVTMGWNGVLRTGRYSPLIVSVENPGKKTSCAVSVDLVSGSEIRGNSSTRTFTQSASIGARSRKRFFFCVPVPSSFRPIVVRVEAGGAEVSRRRIDMSETIGVERLVVAVSSVLSLDFLTEFQPGLRVAYPHVENLPENWAGYDGVEAVFIHDTAFQNLRPSQVSALKRWVFTGGNLVCSGGPAALQLESSGLGDLLPVRVTGLATAGRLSCLRRLEGSPPAPRGDIILATSRLTAGKALLEEEGLPIVASRSFGRGFTRFLAFDWTAPPFSGWKGNDALWRLISGSQGAPFLSTGGQGPLEDAWLKDVIDSPSRSFPSGYVLAAFIALYILLAIALVSRRAAGKVKPRTRAVLLCACAAAASVAGWLLFDRLLFQGDLMIDASVARGTSADGLARVTEKVGLYSTGGGEFELYARDPSVLLDEREVSRERMRSGDFIAETGDGTRVKDVRLPRFGARLFEMDAVVDLGIKASLSAGGGGSRVLSVDNGSAVLLAGGLLVLDGRTYPLGDVPAGGSLRRVIDSAAKGIAGPRDPRRRAFFDLVRGELPGEKPFLVAWLQRSLLPVEVKLNSSPLPGESLHLLSVEVQ